MTELSPFQFPDEDAPLEERKAALAKINAIQFSVDQFERGYAIYNPPGSGVLEPDSKLSGVIS